jgi:cell division protein FtsQ
MHVDPVIAADRVRRHPWVGTADVRRLPTGTVLITVAERTPVALVLAQGRPSHYLDRHGYAMPHVEGAAYDVPVLHGLRTPYHPVTPVLDSLALGVLSALAAVDPEANALVSDVELRGDEAWVYTIPPGARGSIPVRLGRGDVAAKLQRLKAFWMQAVLPQPATRFHQIDLRFASQVITRETAPTTSTSTPTPSTGND